MSRKTQRNSNRLVDQTHKDRAEANRVARLKRGYVNRHLERKDEATTRHALALAASAPPRSIGKSTELL